MTAQDFAKGILARWPSNQPELVADITRLAGKYDHQALDRLMDAIVDTHDGKFIPRWAEVKRYAERAGIHARTANTDPRAGYSEAAGGFVALQCRHCGLIVPVDAQGPRCAGCGNHRDGEVALVRSHPWEFAKVNHESGAISRAAG